MTQEQEQSLAAIARAIAESLIPEQLRGQEWAQRWNGLEALTAPAVTDVEVRARYAADDGEAGEIDQDVLATACLIRRVDI